MSLEIEILTALSPIFPGDAPGGPWVYPTAFPQDPKVPKAPAARFTFISVAPVQDVCGTDEDTADVRTQIDLIARTFEAARALRLQVIAAMQALATPTVLAGGFDDFDEATRLYRCSMDFISYPSS